MSSSSLSPFSALTFCLVPPITFFLPHLFSLLAEDASDPPSLLEEFSILHLEAGCTIRSANGRRCASYSARKIPRVRAYKGGYAATCDQKLLEEVRQMRCAARSAV